jgi:hypothetical protein
VRSSSALTLSRKILVAINRDKVGVSKHKCRIIVFIGLTMTTCFGRAWPSSGHKLCYKLQGENVYMNETYLAASVV